MLKYIILFCLLTFMSCDQTYSYAIEGKTMGTTYHIKLMSKNILTDTLPKMKDAITKRLREIDLSMSTWNPRSEISKFNKLASDEVFPISKDFYINVKTANNISVESNGAFDITVMPLVNFWGFGWKGKPKLTIRDHDLDSLKEFTSYKALQIFENNTIQKTHQNLQIGLDAIAKGFGVDAISEVIHSYGVTDYFVEIGGETVTSGLNNGNQWRLGIEKPNFDESFGTSLQQIVQLSNKALATSGDYRRYRTVDGKRYSHIIDPRTGYPSTTQIASSTVIANDCMTADAIATALMVMGEEEAMKWINSRDDLEAYLILRNGDSFKEVYSNGFKKYLVQN